MLTRDEFQRGLSDQLALGFGVRQISRWALAIHLDAREVAPDVESDLLTLIAMGEGAEFELSDAELRAMAGG